MISNCCSCVWPSLTRSSTRALPSVLMLGACVSDLLLGDGRAGGGCRCVCCCCCCGCCDCCALAVGFAVAVAAAALVASASARAAASLLRRSWPSRASSPLPVSPKGANASELKPPSFPTLGQILKPMAMSMLGRRVGQLPGNFVSRGSGCGKFALPAGHCCDLLVQFGLGINHGISAVGHLATL